MPSSSTDDSPVIRPQFCDLCPLDAGRPREGRGKAYFPWAGLWCTGSGRWIPIAVPQANHRAVVARFSRRMVELKAKEPDNPFVTHYLSLTTRKMRQEFQTLFAVPLTLDPIVGSACHPSHACFSNGPCGS